MYPIRFEPTIKKLVWGSESWEIADRAEARSVVANGEWKGKTLNQLIEKLGEKLLGVGQTAKQFPLLIKIIQAKEPLSIQVHPDEISSVDLKTEPKTEMWVAIEESNVYAGLIQETTPEEFKKAKHPEKFLDKIEMKKGETVYVPGGRIHSILAGAHLLEVQQNSTTTYRLHDWGRKGRELHLKEGLSCAHWHDKGHAKLAPHHQSSDFHHQIVLLGSCPFFLIERIDVFDHQHFAAIPKTFQIIYCVQGEATLSVEGHAEKLKPGSVYLIPADSKKIEVDGRCEFIRIRLS